MHELRVRLLKQVEANFGVVIPQYSERNATTVDYNRFLIEVNDNDPTLQCMVDGKNVEIIRHRNQLRDWIVTVQAKVQDQIRVCARSEAEAKESAIETFTNGNTVYTVQDVEAITATEARGI